MKAAIAIVGVILISGLALGLACARPAPAPSPAPAPAQKPAPAPAPAPKMTPLQEIIEGAKKEGTASVSLVAEYSTAERVGLLRKNIKDKYGVDLNLQVKASSGYAKLVSDAIMEGKTGVVPTYDLIMISDSYVAEGIRAGVFERVDWGPLVEKGTVPEAIPQAPDFKGGIVFRSAAAGLMYNPQKVPAAQVPKTLSDLADPRWKSELGVYDYPQNWVRWAYVLGKDSTFSSLRAIMKNKPLVGLSGALNNRYLLGEISLAFTTSGNIVDNRKKGMPTAFRPIQFLEVRDTHFVLSRRAQHPNAAKLVAVYLASPDGVKYSVDNVNAMHLSVPGNELYNIAMEARKEGIPVHGVATYPGLLQFELSEEARRWQKEAELILKGA